MKPITKRLLFWTPRGLCLLFAAFISIFALDVFDENSGWQLALALGMHLIPTALVLAVLALAWKWEWFGTLAFGALGIFYIWWAWGRFDGRVPLAVAVPLFLLAGLFLVGWLKRKEIRPLQSPDA